MALEIEDGTGKANSNSYVTLEEARAYAAARGVALPADDTELEILLIKAMDFLEAQRARYQGSMTTPETQALQWPRTGVYLNCSTTELGDDVIPTALKSAQIQAAMEEFAGNPLMVTTTGRLVKREKVDVIETEYMTGEEMGAGSDGARFPAIDALLEPLFGCGGGFFLKTVRV